MLPGQINELTSLGAAGVMGVMWLWERRAGAKRERQLDEAHERIMRDEQRLAKLTEVVEHNTAAITQFHQTQHEACELLKHLLEELHHAKIEQR